MGDKFGGLLRRVRGQAGFTMGQLARALEVSTAYLSAMELGFRPPLTQDRILQAAQILKTDPAPLLAAAAAEKGVFEINADGASPRAMETLAALARDPQLTDTQWERIQGILREGGQQR